MTTEDRLRLHLGGKDVTWRTEGSTTLALWSEEGTPHAAILVPPPPTAASIVDAFLVARPTGARLTLVHEGPLSPIAMRSAARFGLTLLDAGTLPEPPAALAPPAPEPVAAPAEVLADVVLPLTLAHEPPAPILADVQPEVPLLPAAPMPEPLLLLPAHEEPAFEPQAIEIPDLAAEAEPVHEPYAMIMPWDVEAPGLAIAPPALAEVILDIPAAPELPEVVEPAAAPEATPAPPVEAEVYGIAVEPAAPVEVAEPVEVVAEAAPVAEASAAEPIEAPTVPETPVEVTPEPVPAPSEVTIPLLEPGFRLPWETTAPAAEAGTVSVQVSAAELASLPWHAHAPIEEHVEVMAGNPRPRRHATRPTLAGAPEGGTWGLPWPRPVAPTDGLSVADPRIWSAQERVHAMRDELDARVGAASFGAVRPDGSPWIKRIQTFGSP